MYTELKAQLGLDHGYYSKVAARYAMAGMAGRGVTVGDSRSEACIEL